MNSGADIYSSTGSVNSEINAMLKERLYPHNDAPIPPPGVFEVLQSDDFDALDELRRLAKAEPYKADLRQPLEPDNTHDELEQKIQAFQQTHAKLMEEYLFTNQQHSTLLDNSLYILNGWAITENAELLTEKSRQAHGGHYLRWKGKGIVLNPGTGFLHNFHQQGLCIRDIDFVIVTQADLNAFSDVKGIYELNLQLNTTSAESKNIHYYLNQQAHRELAGVLKPTSKHARHTIHSLEMFSDSSEVEKVNLDDNIVLNYFLPTAQESYLHFSRKKENQTDQTKSALGISLELSSDTENIKIGYLTGMPWSPLLAHHLGKCDLLLAGFGNTNQADYSKLGYNEDTLGYHGCFSLFKEISPKLMLLTEFGGREGDIRLEITKKLRSDFDHEDIYHRSTKQTLIPADNGLIVNLKTLQAYCSITQENVSPRELRVVASEADFGQLQYLSSSFCL